MMTRGRCSSSQTTKTCSDSIPEFFKIFLPDFSDERLHIPRAFVHQCKRTIPGKIVLVDHGGNSWDVDVSKTADRVYMTRGWKRFVKDQGISTGDFLVCRYDENFSFSVKIFGLNGCKKEASALGSALACVKVEDETEEQNCHQHTKIPEQSQTRTNRSSGLQKTRESELPRKSPRVERTRRTMKPTGVTGQGVPYFIAEINHSRQIEMYIPKNMANKYNVEFKAEMVLCSNAAKCPVMVVQRKDGRIHFGRGWREFVRKNKLKVGDGCKFMFHARGRGNVEVQVLPRAASTSTRLRRG